MACFYDTAKYTSSDVIILVVGRHYTSSDVIILAVGRHYTSSDVILDGVTLQYEQSIDIFSDTLSVTLNSYQKTV